MKPDHAELRKFGRVMGLVVLGLFGGLLPWMTGHPPRLWPYVLGGCFLIAAQWMPGSLYYPQRLWMKFGHVMGAVNSRIILSLGYFCVIVPTGLIMRLSGRDPMRRRLQKRAKTYRVPSGKARSPEAMERPF